MTNDKTALDEAIESLRLTKKWLLDHGTKEACASRIESVLNKLVSISESTRPQPCGDAVKALDDLDAVFLKISKPAPTKYVVPSALTHNAINKLCKHWPTIRAALTQTKADVGGLIARNNIMVDKFKTIKAMIECQFFADGSTNGIKGHYMRTLVKICDEALAAQGYIGVPEGYALVPIEPTREMILSGSNYYQKHGALSPCIPIGIYKAMLKAAPKKEG